MQFFQSLSGHLPLPSVADLEASHFELQQGPYPEYSMSEKQSPALSSQATSGSWIARLFGRSPRSLNEKRANLLRSRTRELSPSRRSSDLESQASTDASTLLENDAIDAEPSAERSAIGARVISDAIIGLSDGLTVPFALTAGLSALGDTRVVIFAGLAELTAGAISMGLGGYLGAKSEEESYRATLTTTANLATTSPSTAASSIPTLLAPYKLPDTLVRDLEAHMTKSPHLTDFLMHFQHNAPEPEPSRAITCALTIAGGYFLGGFLPLLPYFWAGDVVTALWWSLGVMAVSLFVFGYGKTCFVSGWRGRENVVAGMKGGVQMVVVGGLAAGCAMGLVRLFDGFAAA